MTGPWYPLCLRASRLDGGAPPPLPFVPADKWKMRDRQKGKERRTEWYNSAAASAAPEPQALSPLHTATSFGRKLPDLSGRQEVHHRLVALFYGKKLRDLHMPASALGERFLLSEVTTTAGTYPGTLKLDSKISLLRHRLNLSPAMPTSMWASIIVSICGCTGWTLGRFQVQLILSTGIRTAGCNQMWVRLSPNARCTVCLL